MVSLQTDTDGHPRFAGVTKSTSHMQIKLLTRRCYVQEDDVHQSEETLPMSLEDMLFNTSAR